MNLEHFTEAHEARTTSEALEALQDIATKYYQGKETMGVLTMYATAAVDLGCSQASIRTAYLNAKCVALNTNTLRQQ